MYSRSASIIFFTFSATLTVSSDIDVTFWTISLIFEAFSELLSASSLILSATTANPLPASPALAASIEALRDSSCVWFAIASITCTDSEIFLTASLVSEIFSLISSTATTLSLLDLRTVSIYLDASLLATVISSDAFLSIPILSLSLSILSPSSTAFSAMLCADSATDWDVSATSLIASFIWLTLSTLCPVLSSTSTTAPLKLPADVFTVPTALTSAFWRLRVESTKEVISFTWLFALNSVFSCPFASFPDASASVLIGLATRRATINATTANKIIITAATIIFVLIALFCAAFTVAIGSPAKDMPHTFPSAS